MSSWSSGLGGGSCLSLSNLLAWSSYSDRMCPCYLHLLHSPEKPCRRLRRRMKVALMIGLFRIAPRMAASILENLCYLLHG